MEGLQARWERVGTRMLRSLGLKHRVRTPAYPALVAGAPVGQYSKIRSFCAACGTGDARGTTPRARRQECAPAQHVLEMYRRSVSDNSARRLLDRLANRIVKILTETRRLNPPKE
jgi:hypothetical protein